MKAERVLDFAAFDLGPGFRFWVCPSRKFKTLSLRLVFRRALGPDATRLALLPAVLRQGCRRWPTMQKITRRLEDLYGASFGADAAKLGELHLLTFGMETVNDRFSPRRIGVLRQALEFMAEAVARPVVVGGGFRKSAVDQERRNLKSRIESLVNDRGAYALEQCLRAMCAGEPYETYEYGRVEDLPAATPRSLLETHRSVLATAPADLFLLGDVSEPEAVRIASRAFRWARHAPLDPPPSIIRPAPPSPREVSEKLPVEQGKLVIGARTTVTLADDDAHALTAANGILGAFPHSKLFANVREKHGLAYSVHSALDRAKGLLFITAGIDPDKYAQALGVIRDQLKALQDGDISGDEMEKTRASLVARVRAREDSPDAKIAVFHEMLVAGRVLSGEESIARYEALTREHVAQAARKIGIDTIYLLRP